MKRLYQRLFNFLFWLISGLRKRVVKESTARRFSNRILKSYLRFMEGDIINVSGWEDADKEGGFYRDYYLRAASYTVSNISGMHGMPEKRDESKNWIYLDLEKPLPADLIGKFDVVFCHTVLEHVYHIDTAMENLAALTRDVLVLVVPFAQGVHDTSTYGDYFRFTPLYLERFLSQKGFSILLVDANTQPFTNIYIVLFASRLPQGHAQFASAKKRLDIKVFPARFGNYSRPARED